MSCNGNLPFFDTDALLFFRLHDLQSVVILKPGLLGFRAQIKLQDVGFFIVCPIALGFSLPTSTLY